MKSKNLIILCVWLTLTIVTVIWGVVGAGYSHNPAQWLIWTLSNFQVFFFITLVFTGAVAFFMPEN